MYTYSLEHKIFLNKIRHDKRYILFFRFIIIFVFLLVWELLARFNIINTFLFSSPSKVLYTIINLFKNGELIKHISITLKEVIISFSLATIIGLFVASILWCYERLSRIVDPYITVINSLPKVALGPLIIIWVGASYNSIIVMALTICVFTAIINIYSGFKSVNKDYIIMLKSFRANRFQIYRYVLLPSSIFSIIATLKINISMSLIGVIMGELLVSKAGLGYLIMYGSQVFNLDLVISSIFILGIISYLMYFIIDKISIFIKKKTS